jgi:hypothetical protein
LIDQTNSSIQALVVQKSVTNPCKTLPNVADQDEIRPSQTEFVDPKFARKSTETISSTSMLGGKQGKDKEAGCDKTGLTGCKTDLTTSSRVLQNNSKLRMVKPEKIEIGIWKIVEAKAGRKTRNSLARSTRSLVARLELDSFYNEPARFITSQLAL